MVKDWFGVESFLQKIIAFWNHRFWCSKAQEGCEESSAIALEMYSPKCMFYFL